MNPFRTTAYSLALALLSFSAQANVPLIEGQRLNYTLERADEQGNPVQLSKGTIVISQTDLDTTSFKPTADVATFSLSRHALISYQREQSYPAQITQGPDSMLEADSTQTDLKEGAVTLERLHNEQVRLTTYEVITDGMDMRLAYNTERQTYALVVTSSELTGFESVQGLKLPTVNQRRVALPLYVTSDGRFSFSPTQASDEYTQTLEPLKLSLNWDH